MIGNIIILFVMLIILGMMHIVVIGFNGWKSGLVIMGMVDLIILGALLKALNI